jgi:hypothetical protein
MGWSQSAQNALGIPQNLFFHMLLQRASESSRITKFLAYILGAVFSAVALPLVPLSSLFSHGGTLIAVAKPQFLHEEIDARRYSKLAAYDPEDQRVNLHSQ